tara:strand:- start:1490 stop:2512 length:1023 start_codon:yes stop_codon:yes gene_type:complete
MKSFKQYVEAKQTCGDGQYYCFDENKCKDIPEGMKVGKGGMLVKEEKNCGCGKNPCKTYGMKEGKEVPANVKKIAKELDAAVKMHKSQAERLRKAGVSEENVNEIAKKHPKLEENPYSVKNKLKMVGTSVKDRVRQKYNRFMGEEEVKMSRKEYAKIHKDFKSDDPKNPRTTRYVKGKGTVSSPVKFTDEYNPEGEDLKEYSPNISYQAKGGKKSGKLGKSSVYSLRDKDESKKDFRKSHVKDIKDGMLKHQKEDWQRKSGKSESGGLNEKGRKSYEAQNPGSDLKAPVTGKVKKGGKAAGRRKSFCSRMKGMKRKLTSAKTARDPDSRINKSLRKWKCN